MFLIGNPSTWLGGFRARKVKLQESNQQQGDFTIKLRML